MTAVMATYRRVLALSGPMLPVVSFLGRLPMAMCQLGSLQLVARTSGSLATAGLVELSATVAHPAVALALAALLLAVRGSAFALHPTAAAVRPAAVAVRTAAVVRQATDARARPPRARPPRARPPRARMPRPVPGCPARCTACAPRWRCRE
ncbi:hypothetical protein ACFXPQ_11630 [Streptomyces lydicus]|uniref:hypothetical protein n=1 Tax=Streptomyces lydicus TaxID=47763 RepID=UPI0036CEA4C7